MAVHRDVLASTTIRLVARMLREVALTGAAIAGLICIIAVAAAAFFGLSVVMFKTGSMAPTIPTGSAALVHAIPADRVRVGDVVTVPRAGALPVTHRVVELHRVGHGYVVLTLKGDANATTDERPYRVREVRRVVIAIPRLAYVIVRLESPPVVAVVTLCVAALVTMSLWPTTTTRSQP
jgi:signal peptidase